MSAELNTLPKIPDQPIDGIFFERPDKLSINKSSVIQPDNLLKIETLIAQLQKNGPLVACGQIGPDAYIDRPFKLDNKDIYGWKPGALRFDSSTKRYALILEAKKIEDRGHVYFSITDDSISNVNASIREHKSSVIDTRVYVISYKTFLNYLSELNLPASPSGKILWISSSSKKIPEQTKSEWELDVQLMSTLYDIIFDTNEEL